MNPAPTGDWRERLQFVLAVLVACALLGVVGYACNGCGTVPAPPPVTPAATDGGSVTPAPPTCAEACANADHVCPGAGAPCGGTPGNPGVCASIEDPAWRTCVFSALNCDALAACD